MSRSIPWRNKPSNLITEMIPIAKQLKLYFVHEIGPTSLILKDDNNNKFKVVIGNTVSCSCSIVKNDHCIHTLFVLLKKFKVNQEHPILWQASYLDSQLDGLTQHKYQYLGTGKSKQKNSNVTTFLKKKRLQKSQVQEFFAPLDQDEMCPICYQEMNGFCYSTCGVCSKSLHTNCFKVWTKHKQDNKTNVTCPMCRSVFPHPMKIIFRDLQRWQLRFSTHKGTVCKGCGQRNIKGLIYKCLICPSTDLCKMCYEGNQHIEHLIFACKELTTDKWSVSPLRIKKPKKHLFELNNQINYKDLPSIYSPGFILKLLPNFKVFNAYQDQGDLGIVGNQMITKQFCIKCHTPGNQLMIRLNCSHGVHEQCLLDMFSNKEYFCHIDEQTICPGYLNAIGQKVIKPQKPKKKINEDNIGKRKIQERCLVKVGNLQGSQNCGDLCLYQSEGRNFKAKFSHNNSQKLKLKSTISSKNGLLSNKKIQQCLDINRHQQLYLGYGNQYQGQRQRDDQNINMISKNNINSTNLKSEEKSYYPQISKSKDKKNFRINLNANININSHKKSALERQKEKKLEVQSLIIGGFGMTSAGIADPLSSGSIRTGSCINNAQTSLYNHYDLQSQSHQHQTPSILIQSSNKHIYNQSRPPLNKQKNISSYNANEGKNIHQNRSSSINNANRTNMIQSNTQLNQLQLQLSGQHIKKQRVHQTLANLSPSNNYCATTTKDTNDTKEEVSNSNSNMGLDLYELGQADLE